MGCRDKPPRCMKILTIFMVKIRILNKSRKKLNNHCKIIVKFTAVLPILCLFRIESKQLLNFISTTQNFATQKIKIRKMQVFQWPCNCQRYGSNAPRFCYVHDVCKKNVLFLFFFSLHHCILFNFRSAK